MCLEQSLQLFKISFTILKLEFFKKNVCAYYYFVIIASKEFSQLKHIIIFLRTYRNFFSQCKTTSGFKTVPAALELWNKKQTLV